ncbi:hypothetical protein M885DRAFT_505773 [Pelagophyceae sp. CCMP2097]|nr:hypothetical protein M885DRAFT_505773 [Pelagophyceae sp. CCMP2097]|mmetsp:Transcript_30282/g.102131  ORF Transcript_30282/g.102131 Transcript_30282/m.102131 type:complete len:378 (-) Transcript_30282:129-1262(-)
MAPPRLLLLCAFAAPAAALMHESLARLLLQRTLQTQVTYLTDFHDEVKANWLCGYGDPCASLGAMRLSNEECTPKYHGLDVFSSHSPKDYLASMLAAEPITYAVRYAVGRPDMQPGSSEAPDGFVEAAQAGLSMWASAAQSRRSNPFLPAQQKYIEYDDEVMPGRVALLVMSTRTQLAREWARDLIAIGDGSITAAIDLRSSTAAYASVVNQHSLGDDDGSSSPLRSGSLDLCERLATREAVRDVCAKLSDPTVADWLERRLMRDAAPPEALGSAATAAAAEASLEVLLAAAACRFAEADLLGAHDRNRGLAMRWIDELANAQPFKNSSGKLVNPADLARTVLDRRAVVVEGWARDIIQQVKSEDTALLRRKLESHL